MELIAASAEVLDGIDDPWSWLSEAERRRASALVRSSDREDFVAAHVLVRQLVGALVGMKGRDVTIVQRCPDCAGAHGAPTVAGMSAVYVSLAHSGGWVAAAAGRRPCGIDVENVGELRRSGVVRSALTREELEWVAASADPVHSFARLWVRKEALVKVGAARLDDVASICLVDGGAVSDEWSGHRLTALEGPWHGAVGAAALAPAVSGQATSTNDDDQVAVRVRGRHG